VTRPGWAFLPALGGALAHAPLLRYDLLPGLRRPLDLGAAPGGVRLLGDNKTVRGALAMAGGTLAATVALHRVEPYRERLAPELREAGGLRHGALLGAAVVLGELPNSVLKRRLGIEPGERAGTPVGVALAIHDQADFVLGAWPLLAPIWRMSARELAEAFALVAGIHMAVNLAGYALGARTSPL
jgi:CDP-2,3-bis-(O-geranylgeranyl)-sn-glycerol synthase